MEIFLKSVKNATVGVIKTSHVASSQVEGNFGVVLDDSQAVRDSA